MPPTEMPPADRALPGDGEPPGLDRAGGPEPASLGSALPGSASPGSSAPEPALPAVRASDPERHRVVELLGDHASVGRLTLAELEERVALAYSATTRAELAELTKDLPAIRDSPAAGAQPADRPRKASRWFFALMGGSTWRGRRRLSGHVNVVAIMGGDDIDLRNAEIDGSELVINAYSFLGGPTIYVPDSVEVELTGPAILGGNDERGSTRQPRPGSPLIRIRSFAIMGGADVWRLPAEARGGSLKEARRIAKALERG